MLKRFLLLAITAVLCTVSALGQSKSAAPATPVSDEARLWFQACSPLLQVLALFIGVKYTAKTFNIGSRKYQAEWYANFRGLHRDFWKDEHMAKVRKWIANPAAYRNELLPILQRRAVSPEQVTAEEYDSLETVDRFCALLETTFAHNPEALSDDHQWMIESTFDVYWMNTVMADRPDLKAYMEAHWPRLMMHIEEQRARRAARPKAVAAST
jgi:hypothetical protein